MQESEHYMESLQTLFHRCFLFQESLYTEHYLSIMELLVYTRPRLSHFLGTNVLLSPASRLLQSNHLTVYSENVILQEVK
jgi:hypothetical protein